MPDQRPLVEAVKRDLLARGIIPNPQRTNDDAFQITARVAWALKDVGAKLITKRPNENGSDFAGQRFSHDSIAFPDGWIDCLVSAGPPANENRPAWGPTGSSNAPLVAPFNLDAVVSVDLSTVDLLQAVLTEAQKCTAILEGIRRDIDKVVRSLAT